MTFDKFNVSLMYKSVDFLKMVVYMNGSVYDGIKCMIIAYTCAHRRCMKS